jgi:hypothetical protein
MAMFRKIDLAMVAVMVAAVTYTYSVKNSAKHASEMLAAIEREHEAEANAIDLLQADWQVLTAPKRLQSLVVTYDAELGLQPMDAKRVIAVADIPPRPVATDPETSIDAILARFGDVDAETLTGAISDAPAPGSPELEPVTPNEAGGAAIEGDDQ